MKTLKSWKNKLRIASVFIHPLVISISYCLDVLFVAVGEPGVWREHVSMKNHISLQTAGMPEQQPTLRFEQTNCFHICHPCKPCFPWGGEKRNHKKRKQTKKHQRRNVIHKEKKRIPSDFPGFPGRNCPPPPSRPSAPSTARARSARSARSASSFASRAWLLAYGGPLQLW